MIVLAAKRTATTQSLAAVMGIRRVNPARRPYPRGTSVIINWGLHNLEHLPAGGIQLNHPDCVELASDKVATFRALANNDVPTVPWTVDEEFAYNEWHMRGKSVYARSLTRASGGRGIRIIRPDPRLFRGEFSTAVAGARLFTQYVRPEQEYRVHVISGAVVKTVQKLRRNTDNPPEGRFWVRNHANGWVFGTPRVLPTDPLLAAAVRSVDFLGLDFGAVDIIQDRAGIAYVLEVNTAPRLEGQTVIAYAHALQRLAERYA